MHVLATAGHVDHGKSTLVRALTGIEPDRWAEEHRRGLTIDLGYAWTTLPSGREVAFVDVPGHERFIGNMLAGLGPASAVVFVVATATIAAVAGGGGLGDVIVNQAAYGLEGVVGAAICVSVLALAADAAVGLLQRAVTPRGLRAESHAFEPDVLTPTTHR